MGVLYPKIEYLYGKILIKMDDLGVALFQETSMLYCDVSNVKRYIMKHAAYADSSLSIPFQPWRSIPKGSSILGDIYSCKKKCLENHLILVNRNPWKSSWKNALKSSLGITPNP